MSLRSEFERTHPSFPLLSLGDPTPVEQVLEALGVLEKGEGVLRVEKAGEGNMNLTLRAGLGMEESISRSLIVKQARPWVEKYDHIAAPLDRALVEQRFYETTSTVPALARRMPKLLASDAAARVLVLEDLDPASDLTSLYAPGGDLVAGEWQELVEYLRVLHESFRESFDEHLANREMRALNHEHIFVIPLLSGNGLELEVHEPGLSRVAAKLCGDAPLKRASAELGKRYLADGNALLHGDFFPGSWLRTAQGVRVIDPEFGFFGDPEFDLGVAIAHRALCDLDPALDQALLGACEDGLVARYAGIEIIRRLIGVAQLPIAPSTGRRAALLEQARSAVLDSSLEVLR